jgi:uncharacterized protein DUF4339
MRCGVAFWLLASAVSAVDTRPFDDHPGTFASERSIDDIHRRCEDAHSAEPRLLLRTDQRHFEAIRYFGNPAMSQGNDFANYAASVEDRTEGSDDVWFVAVASDDIKQMSVDQLDEAFRLGIISAETAVWTEGMETWAPLGEVADLGSEGESEASAPASTETGASGQHDGGQYDARQYDAGQYGAAQAAASYGTTQPNNPYLSGGHTVIEQAEHAASQYSAPQQAVQHSFGPSSMAPVTSSYAPSGSPSTHLMQSTGPVALNVDEDMPPIRRGRSWHPERWLLAAAGVVAIGVAAFNNLDLISSSSSAATVPATGASTALAARPYEEAGGVERGGALPSTKAASPASDEEPAPAKAGAEDAPIGASAKAATEPAAADRPADDAPAAVGGRTVKASLSAKESLKGSFSKAFTKKATPAKAARASRATKPRKTPSRGVKASKKPGTTRAGSAFDPLNDSLP